MASVPGQTLPTLSDRLRVRVRDLGRVLVRRPDAVSRWVRMAAWRRAEGPAVAEQHVTLDRAIAAMTNAGSREE